MLNAYFVGVFFFRWKCGSWERPAQLAGILESQIQMGGVRLREERDVLHVVSAVQATVSNGQRLQQLQVD